MHQFWVGILVIGGALAPSTAQGRSFGLGCRGHLNGIPTIDLSAPPVMGTSFDLEFDVIAPRTPFLMVMGLSNQSWGGIPLPLEMGLFGFPGCFLNIEFRRPFTMVSNTQGKVKLTVPTVGLNSGNRFYIQLVVPDPGTSGSLGSSAGCEITVVASSKATAVMVIPDSQSYTVSAALNKNFDAQTEWIVNSLVKENIAFVSHVGDLVEDGASGTNQNQAQWDRALSVIARLDGNLGTNPDGLVPHALAIGNHDYDVLNIKTSAAKWTSYFGRSRWAQRSWFAGVTNDGRNHCQVFKAGGRRFMHISLECLSDDDVIAWAQDRMIANPTLPTMLTTHRYLSWSPAPGYDFTDGTTNSSGDNSGLDLREKLVEPFPQVFMAFCGHVPGGGYRQSDTQLGQSVLECLFNYQSDPNGGNSWMNKVEFRYDTAQIRVTCFSPTYISGVTGGPDRARNTYNNFVLSFDLLAHRRTLEANETRRFRQGRDFGHGVYSGAVDTYVNSKADTASYGTAAGLRVVTGTTGNEQALIKFAGILGNQAGRVPLGKSIARAILTLTTEGTGSNSYNVSSIYQLKVPFTGSSTWKSLGGGIQVGSETVARPVSKTGIRNRSLTTRSFDVTATLRAWQAGAPNHGWVMISSGADDWAVRSSDWSGITERPMLTVVYEK